MSQRIQRRRFLQLAGSTLGTIGLSQLDLFRQVQRYNRVLAQPTRRKLALLIGINEYPVPISSLRGCLTDVEMQYELLVHRYGFAPQDILIVSDPNLSLPDQSPVSPPTRQNILDAFETHLIQQAKPDDVIVFHYSGHGSYVRDDNGIPEFNGYNGTIVPTDGRLPGTEGVNDIMGKTLFLLSLALPTDYLTLILDSCHAGGGIRGNTTIRALNAADAQPSAAELEYQAQWMARLNLDEIKLRTMRQRGVAKGVAIGTTQIGQFAAEVPFDGFRAGAFTYLLTRYLWQLPIEQSLSSVFVNLARSTRDVANSSGTLQDPVYETGGDRDWDSQPMYLLGPVRPPAEAVLRSRQGEQVSFWLGGLSANKLSAQQAVFSLMDDQGNPLGEVIQTERRGLVGYGVLQTSVRANGQPGQLLREQLRTVSTNVTLRIGVTDSLMNSSTIALSILNSIPRIEGVLVTQDRPMDYLLGRFNQSAQNQTRQRNATLSAPLNSIGLLTPNLTPVPGSFGGATEALEQAIERLRPRLKMLLAGKMLSQLINGSTSNLNVQIDVLMMGSSTILASASSYSVIASGEGEPVTASTARVEAGTEIQVQVQNREPRHLYVSILVIGSTGEMTILHPVLWDAPEEAARIPAGQTIRVPDPDHGQDQFSFVVQGPTGFFELLVLTSVEPLRDALRSLQAIARSRGTRSGNPLAFAEGLRSANESEDAPVEVVDALLGDLDRGASRGVGIVSNQNSQRIDARTLAAFTMMIEVVT